MLEQLTSNIFFWIQQFISNLFLWLYNSREILFWITAFLIASIIFTWLVKRFTSAKTYFIASMYKTEKANPVFDRFSKHKKFIDFLTTLGIILGFGLIGIDFLYGKKMNKLKRTGLWILSILFLYFVFELVFGIFSASSFLTEGYTDIFGLNLLSFVFALTGFAGFVLFSLAISAVDIISKMLVGVKACPGIAPVIPGVEVPNVPLVIPLHAWISLLIILVIHEGFHGITARKEGFEVKSSGLLLLGFLPIGAFVEPNEEQVKKSDALKQLKVYAAGPIANLFSIIVFWVAFFVLAQLLIVPFMGPQVDAIKREHVTGIQLVKIDEKIVFCGEEFESPAFGVLEKGMVLKEVNGVKIQLTEDFSEAYEGKQLGDEFVFVVDDNGKEKEVALKRNEQGRFGFTVEEIQGKDYSLADSVYLFFYYFLFDFFKWLVILSLLVAVVNFLPIEPFDGGRIARVIIPGYFGFWKEEEKLKQDFIMKAMFIGVILLFILNALPLFF